MAVLNPAPMDPVHVHHHKADCLFIARDVRAGRSVVSEIQYETVIGQVAPLEEGSIPDFQPMKRQVTMCAHGTLQACRLLRVTLAAPRDSFPSA